MGNVPSRNRSVAGLTPLPLLALLVVAVPALACGGESATTEDAPEEEPNTSAPAEEAYSPPATKESTSPPLGEPIAGPLPPLVTDLGVVFPRQNRKGVPLPSVGYSGVLFVDERGCLRLGHGGGNAEALIWPYGYELVGDEGSGLLILDPQGETRARVGGGEVRMSGGLAPSLEALEGGGPIGGLVDERQARQLAELCPAPYWVVGRFDSDEFPLKSKSTETQRPSRV